MCPTVWLACGEEKLPAGTDWLSAVETARAAGLCFPKRRTEYLLRRLAAKHAHAILAGLGTRAEDLAHIEVRNGAGGEPRVFVAGAVAVPETSLTDRAGVAVCLIGTVRLGCDLELVEPRSDAFIRDYFTAQEREHVLTRVDPRSRAETANLIWSAKESALKLLRTGLRRDTRTVAVTLPTPAGAAGWRPLDVRTTGRCFPGWWRRDGAFVLTVVTATPQPAPVCLGDPDALARAVPRHSWLPRPGPAGTGRSGVPVPSAR